MANKNKIAKVLNLYADRPTLRPVGAVMLARVPLFPPVRKRTKTTQQNWDKEYVYDPNSKNIKTIIRVENPKALTFAHKKVFDSLILSALKIFIEKGETVVLINPYDLKKLSGINLTTNNLYLFEIIKDLQDLKITVIYKIKGTGATEERIVPISSVKFTITAEKKKINRKDDCKFLKVRLTQEFVELLNKSIIYSLTPSILQELHRKNKNPYLDYVFKFLTTQTKPQRFELYTLLENVIFKEKLNRSVRKKIKRDILSISNCKQLKQIGISIKEKDGKIYLSYTPKRAPAVTLFFPPRKQSD